MDWETNYSEEKLYHFDTLQCQKDPSLLLFKEELIVSTFLQTPQGV